MADVVKRLCRALAWIVILAVAAGAIFLGLIALLSATAESRLQQQIAALRAAGDPVSPADFRKPSVPPDEDAGNYLFRARSGLMAIADELTEVRQSETYQQGRPTAEELKAIQSALAGHAEAISLVEKATACDDYGPTGDHEVNRAAMRALEAKVRTLLAQGKQDEALGTCVAMFRLARLFEKEPMMVGYLVAVACRGLTVETANLVLQSGPVSPAARQSLDAELARQEGVEGYEWMLKSERAAQLQSICSRPGGGWLGGARRSQEASLCLEVFAEQLALATVSYSEFRAAYSRATRSPSARNWLSSLQPTREAMERTRAQVRCLRVLNALQRAAQEGGPDKVPDLADLGLPPDAIRDPFTGDRLRVEKRPRGWLVYSLGTNRADDGGQIDPFLDFGVGPFLPPPDDAEQ